MSVVDFESAQQRVRRTLLHEISTGHLAPGDKLNEVALAGRLEVSRNTLREAFTALEDYGVIVRRPHRGVHVKLPDVDDVDEIYQLRCLLEPAVLRWSEGLEAECLQACVDDGRAARDAGDTAGIGDANQRFHAAIIAASQSRFAEEVMTRVLALMRLVFLRGSARHEDLHGPYLELNAEIAALVADGEREAAAEKMRTYLEQSRDEMRELMAQSSADRRA